MLKTFHALTLLVLVAVPLRPRSPRDVRIRPLSSRPRKRRWPPSRRWTACGAGPAWTVLPSGEKHSITQTERIGPFLDGSVKVIEGRGYDPDGRVTFNAFGTISYNPATKTYTLHSHAMGNVGDFVIKPTPDGYTWEIPMGPRTLRYTAVIKDGTLKEVGDVLEPGKEPFRNFEMILKRVGDTTWPAGGAVPQM